MITAKRSIIHVFILTSIKFLGLSELLWSLRNISFFHYNTIITNVIIHFLSICIRRGFTADYYILYEKNHQQFPVFFYIQKLFHKVIRFQKTYLNPHHLILSLSQQATIEPDQELRYCYPGRLLYNFL